jgi:hypothetical protein
MADMNELLRQAQEMQERLMAAQAESAETVVEGQAGGGLVKVTTTGNLDFRSITISRDAVDPDDVEMLEDLVLAAVRDAVAKAGERTQEAMGQAGLGGLGGLLG